MGTGGEGQPVPTPRKPRRRRLSRRRFWRRVAWGVFLFGLLLIGTAPALRSLGYLSTAKHAQVTMEWDVVRVASDRQSVLIRVDECGSDYVGTRVARVGADVRFTVLLRPDDAANDLTVCGTFLEMPIHVVHLGFALPPDGRVLASGCPRI